MPKKDISLIKYIFLLYSLMIAIVLIMFFSNGHLSRDIENYFWYWFICSNLYVAFLTVIILKNIPNTFFNNIAYNLMWIPIVAKVSEINVYINLFYLIPITFSLMIFKRNKTMSIFIYTTVIYEYMITNKQLDMEAEFIFAGLIATVLYTAFYIIITKIVYCLR